MSLVFKTNKLHMKNNTIASILEKYCEIQNPERTGLLLLDLPTGFGKTYEVLKYIFENYKKSDKKILFLTELKKNLPHEDLRKFFEKGNKLAEYEKEAVFINSNVDCVLENLSTVRDLIPDEIKESQELKNLEYNIQFYIHLSKKKNTSFDIQHSEKTKKEIQDIHEPNFREFIIKKFYDKTKTKEERINLLKNDKNFQWITKIYPASLSFEKKIFFLSVSKFLVKNSPIIEKSYYFFDEAFLKNALIFIDEFDASKEVILKSIIETQLKKRTDIIGLFEQIYSSFTSLTIPTRYYKNSKAKEEQRKKRREKIEQDLQKDDLIEKDKNKLISMQKRQEHDKDISDIIEGLKKEVKAINEDYRINYSVKTSGLENQKNFLFHDYQYHTIVGDKKSFIYLHQDDIEGVNNIHFVEKDAVRKDKPTVTELLNSIRGFINFFKGGSKLIAENYQQREDESNDPTDEKFNFENALNSFLEELKLNDKDKKYLIDSIKNRQFRNRQKGVQEENRNDFSFYANGFRYYDFEDNEMHHTKSKIYITDFDTTPEKILLDLANNNFVVGISATAKMQTVIGNYDLKYLRKNLDDNFFELSEEENLHLKNIFEERTKNYVPIKTEFIGVEDWKKTLSSFNFEKTKYNELLTDLEKYTNEESKNFEVKRYLKIAKVYEQFIKNDNIKSFLCFLNTHPDFDKPSCDLNFLEKLFEAIITEYKKEGLFTNEKNIEVKQSYFVLNSKDFEDKKNNVLERLRGGQKIFLITAYQTLGAGQNIQYGLDNFDELITSGKIKEVFKYEGQASEKKKDFDAVYLDKPTNLLVNLGNEKLTDFDVNKRIFEIEMFFQSNQIFYKQLVYEIKRTFKQAYYKDRRFESYFPKEVYRSFYQTEDYRNFVAKEVIQAIGRINRANFKNKEIYIFADKEIAPNIKYFDTTNYICLKEFKALIEQAQFESGENLNDNNEKIMEIEQNNIYCHNWINAKVKGKYWNEKTILDWRELRELALKYPTISKKEFYNSKELKDWQFIYVPMLDSNFIESEPKNSYHYSQENDFSTIQIDFAGNGTEVSANKVYLPQLMKLVDVKAYFERQNYATDFKKNDYIIAPEIFNNIYKGALGEIIGKFLLEKFIIPDKNLEELPQTIFEKFDYMLGNGVFIDFKFWNDGNNQSREDQIKKIFEIKIPDLQKKKINFQKVFIINILAEGKYKIATSNNGQLIEVPYLVDNTTFQLDTEIISELRNLLKDLPQ